MAKCGVVTLIQKNWPISLSQVWRPNAGQANSQTKGKKQLALGAGDNTRILHTWAGWFRSHCFYYYSGSSSDWTEAWNQTLTDFPRCVRDVSHSLCERNSDDTHSNFNRSMGVSSTPNNILFLPGPRLKQDLAQWLLLLSYFNLYDLFCWHIYFYSMSSLDFTLTLMYHVAL